MDGLLAYYLLFYSYSHIILVFMFLTFYICSVVPVRVIYEEGAVGPYGAREWLLDLSMTDFRVETGYVNQGLGLSLTDDILRNPMTADFQLVSTSLLPGLLLMLAHHRAAALPLCLFEVADVVLCDSTQETGARNERHVISVHSSIISAFEVIHGLLDRLMKMLGVSYKTQTEFNLKNSSFSNLDLMMEKQELVDIGQSYSFYL